MHCNRILPQIVSVQSDAEDFSEALTSPCLLFMTVVPDMCPRVFIRKG